MSQCVPDNIGSIRVYKRYEFLIKSTQPSTAQLKRMRVIYLKGQMDHQIEMEMEIENA